MWPFKKKNVILESDLPKVQEVVVSKKPVLKTIRKEEEFEVGKTTLLIKFQDGRQFESIFYGQVWQSMSSSLRGDPNYVPSWQAPCIYNSQDAVKDFIRSQCNYSENSVHVDDALSPRKVVSGRVLEIEILRTESHPIKLEVVREVELLE